MLTKNIGVMAVHYNLANGPKTAEYPVVAWERYGVVCPGKFTTNGSANFLADCLIELWEKYDCKWYSPNGVPGPDAGKEVFAQAMRDVYQALESPPFIQPKNPN